MATGADWMSAASFVGMAGTLFLLGYDGLAFVLGWTGGYVLVAILIAPFLRKFGAYTVPDFFAARFGGNFAALPRGHRADLLLLHLRDGADLRHRPHRLALPRHGLHGRGLCRPRRHPALLDARRHEGGDLDAGRPVHRADRRLPHAVVILSAKKYGIPIPQLTYGQAIADITAREQQMIAHGLATAAALKPHITPFITYKPLNYFALILCLMVGTASLPHILMRYFTTPSVREARQSVAWSLFFIFLLYFTAPAYAAFSKLEVYSNLIGRDARLTGPAWMFTYGKLGLVKICGADAAIDRRHHRRPAGDRQSSGRAPAAGPQHQYGRDRALDARDRGHAVRDRRSRRRRRPCRRAVDGRRPPARHRQRAQPRHLLQDDQPERPDGEPSHRVAHPAGRRGRRGSLHGIDAAADILAMVPGRSRWRQPASSRRSSWASGGSGQQRRAPSPA